MRSSLLLLVLLCAPSLWAQDTLRHYFSTGELSCIEIKYPFDSGSNNRYREELVKVFDKEANEVFSNYRRNYAGSANIRLQFHKNGAVKHIRFVSHPDGGIQYYRAYYDLDTNGVVINKQIDNREGFFKDPSILDKEEKPFLPNCPPLPQNECATILITQIGIVNKSGKRKRIRLSPPEKKNSALVVLLNNGDTLNSKELIHSESFPSIQKSFQLEVAARSKRKDFRRVRLNSLPQLKVKDNKQERYFLYFILD